jgi:hypothetical protein
MKKNNFLSYLVEFMVPIIGPEWKNDKRVQYVCLGILIVFIVGIIGGILFFNFSR